jgi:16S rRNA G966 N2-methylase RsmD
MGKKATRPPSVASVIASPARPGQAGRPSALLDTRVDNLEQLAKLPHPCVDLIYIDPPFNFNRNYEVF